MDGLHETLIPRVYVSTLIRGSNHYTAYFLVTWFIHHMKVNCTQNNYLRNIYTVTSPQWFLESIWWYPTISNNRFSNLEATGILNLTREVFLHTIISLSWEQTVQMGVELRSMENYSLSFKNPLEYSQEKMLLTLLWRPVRLIRWIEVFYKHENRKAAYRLDKLDLLAPNQSNVCFCFFS